MPLATRTLRLHNPVSAVSPTPPPTPPPSTYETAYAAKFREYTARTDGKQKIANWISAEWNLKPTSVLLDLGAGNGEISRRLNHICVCTVVEKNPAFYCDLAAVHKPEHIILDRMENLIYDQLKADFVLLSYSLNSMMPEILADLVKSIVIASSSAKILLCSDAASGAWHEYAGIVCRELGLPRHGGIEQNKAQLKEANLSVMDVGQVDTQIYGASPRDLVSILGIFFLRYQSAYQAKSPCLERLIEPLLVPSDHPDYAVALPVKESICRIVPTGAQ